MARNYEDIIRKLKRLANDKSFVGESTTAEEFIKRISEKYGIDINDTSSGTMSEHWFRYDGSWAEWKLLVQIIGVVTYNHNEIGMVSLPVHKGRKQIGCECTELEAVKIEAMFNFYKNKLFEDVQTLVLSFIMKHNIFTPEPPISMKDLKDEEVARRIKAMGMFKSLSEGDYDVDRKFLEYDNKV